MELGIDMKYYYYKFWLTSSRGTDELTIKVYEEPQDADNLMYDCKEWASHFGAWTASENMVRYGWEEIKHIPTTRAEVSELHSNACKAYFEWARTKKFYAKMLNVPPFDKMK